MISLKNLKLLFLTALSLVFLNACNGKLTLMKQMPVFPAIITKYIIHFRHVEFFLNKSNISMFI